MNPYNINKKDFFFQNLKLQIFKTTKHGLEIMTDRYFFTEFDVDLHYNFLKKKKRVLPTEDRRRTAAKWQQQQQQQ